MARARMRASPPRSTRQNPLEENPRVPQTPTTPPRLLAAASVFAFLTFPVFCVAAPASAQSGSSLDLTLNTGGGSSARTTAISAPSVPKRSSRSSGRGGSRGSGLTSRGRAFTRQANTTPQVLGRLAVVEVAQALIRRDANMASRVLSPVPQGTYVAIGAEQADFFGVRMIDGSTGWVARSDVRIVPYEMAVRDPNAPAPQPPATGGDLQLPDGLDSRTTALFREAFTYLGVPYVWGGNGRTGLDCSAFVRAVFATQGVNLPRVAADQANVGDAVFPANDLRPGDRLYFDMGNKGRVSHTGIYLGNGYFIHASSNQGKVGIDPLTKPSYYKALVCARRS